MPSATCFTKKLIQLVAERAGVSHLRVFARLLAMSSAPTWPRVTEDDSTAELLYGADDSVPPTLVDMTDPSAVACLQQAVSAVAGRRFYILLTYFPGGKVGGCAKAFYSAESERVVLGDGDEEEFDHEDGEIIWAKVFRPRSKARTPEIALDVALVDEDPPPDLLAEPPALADLDSAVPVEGCYLRALASVLGARVPPEAPLFPSFMSMLGTSEAGPADADGGATPDAVEAFLPGHRVVLACHEGFAFASLSGWRRPSNQRVMHLGELGADGGERRVVGLTTSFAFFFEPEFEAAVKAGAVNPAKPRTFPQPEARPQSRPAQPAPAFPCKCPMCSEDLPGHKYAMTRTVPQHSHTEQLSAEEVLLACGMASPDNLARIRQVLKLSLMSFDLESFCVALHTDFPLDSAAGSEPISFKNQRTGPISEQEIGLVGYCDLFCDEDVDEDNVRAVCERNFTVFARGADGVPDSSDGLLEAFFKHVAGRCELLTARKREILRPMTEAVERYRAAHDAFFESRGVAAGEAKSCFSRGFFGQLDKKLQRLAKHNFLNSFNGQNYDSVLSFSGLAAAAKKANPAGRISLIRAGCRVKLVNFVSLGLKMIDISCLTAGSYSLSSLASITGVSSGDLQKSVFPFRRFTSMAFLEEREMPTDPADYANVAGDPPEQAAVDAVVAEFRREGMQNVGQYMLKYLKADTVLLELASLRLLSALADITSCHALDFSTPFISSWSIKSAHAALYKRRRVAFYHLENPSEAGEDSAPINGHLFEDNDVRPAYTHYLDVNSYDASSEVAEAAELTSLPPSL